MAKRVRIKPKRYENKKHMDYIHMLPCCLKVTGACFGVIQAHHLLRPWDGTRGMSLKASDRNLIPLCQRHHIMLHKRGNELAFFEETSGYADYGKVVAQRHWKKSPHNDDEE